MTSRWTGTALHDAGGQGRPRINPSTVRVCEPSERRAVLFPAGCETRQGVIGRRVQPKTRTLAPQPQRIYRRRGVFLTTLGGGIVIEIVVAAVAVVVCAAMVFGMAVWMLAQAERYDVSERADARRPDDLAGLNVFDGGWDD